MWGEVLIGLLGAGASLLTWWLNRKKNKPLSDALRQAAKTNEALELAYAKAIGRLKTLEKIIEKYQSDYYADLSIDELLDLANAGVPEPGDDDSSN